MMSTTRGCFNYRRNDGFLHTLFSKVYSSVAVRRWRRIIFLLVI